LVLLVLWILTSRPRQNNQPKAPVQIQIAINEKEAIIITTTTRIPLCGKNQLPKAAIATREDQQIVEVEDGVDEVETPEIITAATKYKTKSRRDVCVT
jgi:hypothetical protein